MCALVIKHVESEGPGTLGEFLLAAGWDVRTACVYDGCDLPRDPRDLDALIVMGGPMGAGDTDRHPWLRPEAALLRRALEVDLPVLGICLGAQLLARACGAAVYRAPAGEFGWDEVALTDAGLRDPLFLGLPERLTVFQWHEDTFDLPRGARRLATSAVCPHQAFGYGRAYGLQFHLEVTPDLVAAWFDDPLERAAHLDGFRAKGAALRDGARRVWQNFARLAAC